MNPIISNLKPDEAQVKTFLQGRIGVIDAGFMVIFCAKGKDGPKRSKFFGPGDVGKAALHCVNMCQKGWDVYFGQGILKSPLRSPSRGKEIDVAALLGFWFDCDLRGGGHLEDPKNLPKTEEAKAFFRDEIPFRPSQVIHSGGGLHLHWLFSEPFYIRSEDDRTLIKDLSERFQLLINKKMKAHKWKQDNTSDLVRVLRVPGTFNFKSEPVMVEVI
jgi:hypothetical protein